MRIVGVIFVAAVLLASCEGDYGPGRRQPSQPAEGNVVASLKIDNTEFVLHDEGGGCAGVDIHQEGLQVTVDRRCFGGDQVIAETDNCGWRDGPEIAAAPLEADRVGPICDVILPVVFYGFVGDGEIGFVCLGTFDETSDSDTGVVGARFVDVNSSGFILEPARPGESTAAHLFTSGGLRWGDEPLDAPSDPIYRFCEAESPWGDVTEAEYWVEVSITADEELMTDELAFGAAGGTGGEAVSGGALQDEPVYQLGLRVPASGKDLTVWVLSMSTGDRLWEQRYPWPDEVIAVLSGELDCDRPRVAIHFGPEAPTGDVSIAWDGSDCEPDRLRP